jgi:hypothetical protein
MRKKNKEAKKKENDLIRDKQEITKVFDSFSFLLTIYTRHKKKASKTRERAQNRLNNNPKKVKQKTSLFYSLIQPENK